MARDESSRRSPPAALDRPAISLVGSIDAAMVEKLRDGLAEADEESDLAIEMTTPGGAADLGRRMADDIARAAARRRGRLLFLGRTQVYSAGMTVLAAFPRNQRYLTADAVLLIHSRHLETTIELRGPIRTSLPRLEAVHRQLELGLELERQEFLRLIAGSDITSDEINAKALHDWYLTADEARRRGLVEDLV